MVGFSRRRKDKKFNPWYGFLLLVVLVVAFSLKILDAFRDPQIPTSDIPAVSYEDIAKPEPEPDVVVTPEPDTEPVVEPEPEPTPTPAPGELNLAVPFTSQAPYRNWDELHNDACEEASFYMVIEYYNGMPAGEVDPATSDPELIRMVHAEEELGMGPSISLAQAQDFLMRDSGTVAVIVENPTVEDIKALVAAGKPVIVPAAGRELGNPNFTGEGPLYHMFVIRGYTDTTFITNDPGTRLGQNYIYDIDVVMEAMGDWVNEDPHNSPKRIMYIEPK
jgi:hypothetical protein